MLRGMYGRFQVFGALLCILCVGALASEKCRPGTSWKPEYLSTKDVAALGRVTVEYFRFRSDTTHPATIRVSVHNTSERPIHGELPIGFKHTNVFGQLASQSFRLSRIDIEPGESVVADVVCEYPGEKAVLSVEYQTEFGEPHSRQPIVVEKIHLVQELPETCDGSWNPDHANTA